MTAFGIGAIAGIAGYATGGAAYAAAGGTAAVGSGGALLGIGSRAVGFIGSSSVSTVGNGLLLGDPVPSLGDQIKGLGISVATAGIVNGTSAAIDGRNFWTGAEKALGRGTFSFNNTPKIQEPPKVQPLGKQLLDATKPKTTNHLIIEGAGEFSESEINSAVYMYKQGHDVFLRTPKNEIGVRTSDLLINNAIPYDVYTPQTSNLNRIVGAIANKNSQASEIILDLSKSNLNTSDINSLNLLNRVRGTGAMNINHIIITKNVK